MKVLHFYPESDSMIAKYVSMLSESMGKYAEVSTATNLITLRKYLHKQHPDILHLHGCWTMAGALAARTARKNRIRVVLTPHGQLEQWIIKQNYWKEKLPKMLAYQKKTVKQAYSVVAMGRMEENNLKRMKWNTRIEIVRNPLITESISEEETGLLMHAIYQKVLDTDVLSIMKPETRNALEPLIKAGLTGNHLWLNDNEYNTFREPETIDWRMILIYAYQENIMQIISDGMEALRLPVPNIALPDIPYYQPDGFTAPEPLSKSINGDFDDNRRIVAMTGLIRKHVNHKRLTISHIVEMAAELRHRNVTDDKVAEMLDDKGLSKFAGCLMQVLADLTGLEEGFMPVKAINDKTTKKIKRIITKHLEI